jgi:hypothetical protein
VLLLALQAVVEEVARAAHLKALVEVDIGVLGELLLEEPLLLLVDGLLPSLVTPHFLLILVSLQLLDLFQFALPFLKVVQLVALLLVDLGVGSDSVVRIYFLQALSLGAGSLVLLITVILLLILFMGVYVVSLLVKYVVALDYNVRVKLLFFFLRRLLLLYLPGDLNDLWLSLLVLA